MVSQFNVMGHEFTLETSESVFAPTSTTRRLADHMTIPKDATVLDLGCGSGPLAILAAKMGAKHVYAVDVMKEACELTRRNAERNGLHDRISTLCGSLFEPVQGLKFDVIVDDVSGVADRVARLSPWFPPPIPTGGSDGTDLIIKVLDQARDFLVPGGTIYFPVLSLSCGRKITEYARQLFADSAQCLAQYKIPFCKELIDSIDELNEMRKQGMIGFQQFGSRFVWYLEIWRCQAANS